MYSNCRNIELGHRDRESFQDEKITVSDTNSNAHFLMGDPEVRSCILRRWTCTDR